jgi:hypothetical protein
MAKKIKIDIEVNGKMQKATVSTKKLKDALDGVDKSQKKVGETAQTTDRRLKGVSQQSANGTKNFSKMAQGIGGTLVPAYAVLASNLFAVSAAFEFLKNAAQVEQLEKAQVAFAQNTGIALGSITTSLRNASNGLLGFREAAEAAAIGTAKGFSSKQLNDLADGAQRASVALGRNFTDSFDRLVRGISKAEPELLDELGITLRLEKATNDYAASLGITADALTDVQRSQAVLVATQKQLDEFFGNVPAGQNAFVKLSKTFEDIVKNITMGLLPAFNFLADIINRNAVLAIAAFTGFAVSIISSILPIETLSTKFETFRANSSASLDAAKNDLKSYKAEIERVVTASDNLAKKGQGRVQAGATTAVMGGSKSKILEKVSTSGFASLAKVDQANLKRMLDAATGHVDKFGIVTKGAFKGVSLAIVNDMQKGLAEIEQKVKVTETRFKFSFKNMALGVKIAASQMTAYMNSFFSAVIAGTKAVGKAFKFMTKIITSILTLQFVGEILKIIPSLIQKLILNLAKGIDFIFDKLGFEGPGLTFTEAFTKSDLNDYFRGVQKDLKDTQDRAERIKNSLRDLRTLGGEAGNIAKAAEKRTFTPKQVLNTYSTLDFATPLTTLAQEGLSAGERENIFEDLVKDLTPLIKTGQFTEIGEALLSIKDSAKAGRPDLEALGKTFTNLQKAASEAVAEQKSFTDQLTRATEVASGGNFDQILNFFGNLEKTALNANVQAGKLNQHFEGFPELIETAFGEDISSTALVKSINNVLTRQETDLNNRQAAAQRQIQIEHERNQFSKERLNILNDVTSAEEALEAARTAQLKATIDLTLANEGNEAARTRALTAADREVETAIKLVNAKRGEVDIRTKLNDVKEEGFDLGMDQTFLQTEQKITQELQKQFTLRQKIQDTATQQARADMEQGLANQARRPFGYINQERRELEARIEFETDLIKQKEAQIEDEIKRKQQLIDLEYDLLAVQFKLEKTKLETIGLNNEELKPQTTALIAEIDSKVLGAGGALETNRALAKDEVETSARAALADLIRNRDNLQAMKEDLTDINVLTDGIAQRFEEGMATAFTSILDGTAKAKDAFANMAKSILQYIIEMTVKMLIFRAISSFMGSMGVSSEVAAEASTFGQSAVQFTPTLAPPLRSGGIISEGRKMPGYSAGGIARGSQAGYPAMLHGTEAVVPLPNGRSIPVQMSGAGQENNVTVNVAVDNQGASNTNTQSNGAQAEKLGVAISEAVKKELLNQKRVGGMLSPYGVA